MFAGEGAAAVVIADLPESEGRSVAEEIGAVACFAPLDVTDAASWTSLAEVVRAEHGRVDVLVNNAGVWLAKGLMETSPEEYRRVVEVNQTGVFLGMWAVAGLMREARSGSIVNISSNAGLRGGGMPHAYAASKWAVRGMSQRGRLGARPLRRAGQRRVSRVYRHSHDRRGQRGARTARRRLPFRTGRNARRSGQAGGVPRQRREQLHIGRGGRDRRRVYRMTALTRSALTGRPGRGLRAAPGLTGQELALTISVILPADPWAAWGEQRRRLPGHRGMWSHPWLTS